NAFIIPNELPSILSLVYSNIPTIKKGTDSRLGWGFRLGNRADFQVLVELGPQTNTQPLGDQPQPSSSNSKRNSPDTLANVLYAQRQREKAHFSNTDGGKWLKEWSQYIKDGPPYIGKPLKTQKIPRNKPGRVNEAVKTKEHRPIETVNPVLGIGEIDAKLVIPEDDIGNKKETLRTTEAPRQTTTSKKDALDNVTIDD
ncbi:hypothetical protein AMK59_1132, partial [Oryctes borbonicus]